MNHPNSGFVRGTNELPIECWGMPRLMKRFKLREDGECMQSCRRAVSRSVLREQPRTICFDWRGILAACVEEDQEGSFFFFGGWLCYTCRLSIVDSCGGSGTHVLSS
mmetsp:Transcript_8477/g.16344  ORF Transcript_8477/g.16344 Transcript_8477/m.16344 type:complete len:107 (+) Transcript_8477:92-412(+)